MKPRILIVEDEPLMAAQISQQLTVLGYDPVATTAYGEEAVDLAGKKPFDLALVDLRLAGEMDGISAAIILREHFALASIMMTAAPDKSQIERAIRAQPYGYLMKPFNTQVLYLAVEMALQRIHTETTLRQREEQLEAVLRTSMDSFWIVGVDGRISEVNEAACRMTGYSREELLRMTIIDLEHGRTNQQIAGGIDQVLTKGSVQMERQIQRKDGQLRLIDMSVTCSPPPMRRLYCFGRDITERRRNEQALRDSERHLRATLDSLPDTVALKDNEGRYLAVNAVWMKTYGFGENEVIGKTDFDLFPHEKAVQYTKRDEQVRKSLKPISAEVEHKHEGRTIWQEVHKIPFFDAEGNFVGLVSIARDITDKKHAGKRLLLLNRAIEQSTASIVITDPLGTIEYVNPYFEKHTGYTRDEALGQNPRILKASDKPDPSYENLWKTITAGQEWRGEFCNKKKNGTLYWEQASISPVRDDTGRIINFVAVKEDITERKATELSMALQAALVSNSSDICCVKDFNLRVLYANQAMARAAGVENPDSLIGKTDAEIFGTPENSSDVKSYMADERAAQRLGPGQFVERQERVYHADRTEHFMLTRKFPVFDRTGQLIATANISTDITEAKHAERELIRAKDEAEGANRTKSAFLATMSHELRTPLNVINGMSALLAQENWSPEHRHAINLISEGGQTLLNIIEEILDYSGLQAGKTTLEETPFSIASVISSALRLCATSAQPKGLDLTCWLDPKMPAEALGDPRRLQQVLVNLLHNAIKFTERGRIHLRLAVQNATSSTYTLEFSVFDSGIGIAAENIDKLFLPFSQADDSITRRFGGTGLGLVITKSFVNLMGGDISVCSRLNLGSVFRFQVNLKATSNRKTAFSNLSAPVLQKRRVLIMQGAGAQQRMLATLIHDWGMRPVMMKPTQIQTGSPYPDHRYDIAILPIQEASDAGHPLSLWLAQQSARLPIVWLGRKDLPSPACCTAPSVRLGTLVDPVDLSQALSDLLASTSTLPAQLNAKLNKPRPLAEIIPLSILAAEDNPTNREVIKLVLRNLGYTVDLVENGAEAVIAVKNKKYDLLLLDMQMPVMDGLTAAREICRLIPDPAQRLKIVALTANALPSDRQNCLDAGMDAYLTKPILPVDLSACIRRIFQSSGTASPSPAAPQSDQTQTISSDQPWIDTLHLETITMGLSPEQSLDTLRQLHASVCADYKDNFPSIVECCGLQDQAHFAETIHGLKGCFMMIGWSRAGMFCAEALASARKGEFKDWPTFADKLNTVFNRSSEIMSDQLNSRNAPSAPPSTTDPTISL